MVLTLEQQSRLSDFSTNLINLLDTDALIELTGGYESDLDNILKEIDSVATEVLFESNTGKIKTSFNYLTKFSDVLNESLRCSDINYFALEVVPQFKQEWFHVAWGRLLNIYQYLNIIAPRDHGKTWFFSFLYSLWHLYRYKRSTALNPTSKQIALSEKGMILSAGRNLSRTILGMIKTEIRQNDILNERLYEGKSDNIVWGADEIRTKNGAELRSGSYGSNLRGFHPGWASIDDFHSEKDLYSATQNQKKIDFFNGVVMQMVDPVGQVVVVGTPFSDFDLYSKLKKDKAWKVFEYPAILPDGTTLHPSRYNLKKLLQRKESIGNTLFSREILCKPISSESSIFPYSLLQTAFVGMDKYELSPNIHSFKRKGLVKISIGVDFAKSANIGADATVAIVVGEDEAGHIWLLWMWRKVGATYAEQINEIKRLNSNFNPDIILLETNGFQQIYYEELKDYLPVVESKTGNDKKSFEVGIPSLEVLFEQSKIHFPRGDEYSRTTIDEICKELTSMTWTGKGLEGVGAHDDIPVALWKAVKGLKENTFNFNFI